MYSHVLIAHGWWRWVVIVAGVAALAAAWHGYRRGAPWQQYASGLGRLFGIAIDIQVLLGAALYLFLSPLTTIALDGVTLPEGSELQFFQVYHGLIMLGAFLHVHISAMLVKRGKGDAGRYRRSLILYSQTLLLIVCAIPWWRPLFR